MPIDDSLARSLGWPKLKYAAVERERRWLCRRIPDELVLDVEHISDLYVDGTRLRLREAIPLSGGAPIRRLTRKGDLDARHRLLTSIYLEPHEFELFAQLPGLRLVKTRHRLQAPSGVALCADRFEGALDGLLMAEAEFDEDSAMADFPMPDFALREVTDDPRYHGGSLALNGVPAEAA